jgi:hypothetical protein
VALERKFKIRASELSSGVAMEHLAFLAFEGAKQNGITVPAVFDDYIKRLVSVDVVGEDAANQIPFDTQELHTMLDVLKQRAKESKRGR